MFYGSLNCSDACSVTGSIATQMMTLRVKFDTPIHSSRDTAMPQNTVLKRMMPNRFLMVLVIEVVWFLGFIVCCIKGIIDGDMIHGASGLDDTHLHGDGFSKRNVLQRIS